MEHSFRTLFPELVTEANELYTVFATMAMVFVFIGLLVAAWRSSFGDISIVMRGLATAGIIAVVLSVFPNWVDHLQIMLHGLVNQIDANPSESHQLFAELIAGPVEKGVEEAGFWDVLWADDGGLGKEILFAVIWLMGQIALAIMWLFFIVQQLILIFGVATSPVFLAMLALELTKPIGIKFLMSLFGVICWPIGWAIADKATQAFLRMAADARIFEYFDKGHVLGTVGLPFLLIVLSIWILVSTIAAPVAVSKMLQSGIQIGSSLLSSLGTATAQGASYATGAGITAAMAGGSERAVAGAAMAGGAGGLASGAAGTSGLLMPAMIGTMAAMTGFSSGGQDPNKKAEAIARKAGK